MADLTPHALIQSFVSGLSDFLTTIVPPGRRSSTPRWIFVAGSDTTGFWVSDVDGDLVGIADDGSHTGNTSYITTSQMAAQPSGTTKMVPNVIFSLTSGSGFISGIRYPVRRGDKLWFFNGSASPMRMTLWFET